MVKNVLVGVDGRSGGHDAVALALRLGGTRGQLTLIHVHRETTGIVVHDFDTAAREEAHWLLEGEREAAGPDAKSISIAAMLGSTSRHLTRTALPVGAPSSYGKEAGPGTGKTTGPSDARAVTRGDLDHALLPVHRAGRQSTGGRAVS